MPDGRRTTFFYTPYAPSGIFGFLFVPEYTAEPGTYGTLTSNGCELVTLSAGQWFCFPGPRFQETVSTYTYTDPYGREFVMSIDGTLQSIRDLNNNTLTFSENGISSDTGLNVPFVRDAEGRITQITNTEGNVYSYAYDTDGNLLTLTQPGNPLPLRYSYDSNRLLTEGFDGRGNRALFSTYYPDGRLQSVTDGLGNTTGYAYDLPGNFTVISYPDGGNERVTYNAEGYLTSRLDPLGRTTSFDYDANYNILTETNGADETTTYTYNGNGQRTSVTDALGNNLIAASYNEFGGPTLMVDALGQQRSIGYDPNTFMPLSASDSLGSLGSYTWDSRGNPLTRADANGQTTGFTYDPYGNVASQTDALGRTWNFTYDTLGRRTTSTDPQGNVTSFSYDPLGRLLTVTDVLNQVTTYEYDGNGNRTAMIDALGQRMDYEYDANDNLTRIVYPDSTAVVRTYDFRGNILTEADETGIVTRYEYDVDGQLIRLTLAEGTPDATTSQNEYDNAGRQIRQIDGRGNVTTFTYDARGRLTVTTDVFGNTYINTYDAAGQLIAQTDELGRTTQFVYDSRGRQIQTIFPDGTFTATTYDSVGRQLSRADQNGNITQWVYDGTGQLLSVTNPMSEVVSYTYDARGNLTSIIDANNHVTAFEFDDLNRQTRKAWADGTFESMGYNAIGNLTQHQLADGNINNFFYDNRNRLVREEYFDGQVITTAYTPDSLRASVTDGRGVTTYSYDALNRTTSVTQPDGMAISYTYDTNSNRTSMTTPAGTISYAYDALNRVSSLTDPRGAVTNFSYNAVSQLQQQVYPNGVVADYGYDTLNRLTSINHHTGVSVLASFDYALDNAGNRIGVTEADGSQFQWGYDDAYRLLTETRYNASGGATYNAVFTYDAMGNRLSQTENNTRTDYAYNNLDQLVSSITDSVVTDYTYNPRGNLTTVTTDLATTSYAWDARDRMVGVGLPDGSAVSYVYDADNQRVQENVDGEVTNFLWDSQSVYGDVVVEYDAANTVQTDYTLAGMQLVSQHQGSETHFYHADGQNSTRVLSDTSNAVVNEYTYKAFGEVLSSNTSAANRYLYTGQQFDVATGQYSLRARYYNAGAGRFTARDTFPYNFQNPVELNRYGYVSNSPVNLFDPTGFESEYANIQASLKAGLNRGIDIGTRVINYTISSVWNNPVYGGAFWGAVGYFAGIAAYSAANSENFFANINFIDLAKAIVYGAIIGGGNALAVSVATTENNSLFSFLMEVGGLWLSGAFYITN